MLLETDLIDYLAPKEKENNFYTSFISKYSLITVTAVVSQSSLIPEDKSMIKDLDAEYDQFIDELANDANIKRSSYKYNCRSAGIDPGKLIQDTEQRLFSENFKENAKKHSLSSREFVLRGLNSFAYLNYFCLFEDSIKTLYMKSTNSTHQQFNLKACLLVSEYLKEIINVNKIKKEFEKNLFERSKFFFDFVLLEKFWDILNCIRNQLIHCNGFCDKGSRRQLTNKINKFIKYYQSNLEAKKGCLISIVSIGNYFEGSIKSLVKTNFLVIDNKLENLIRNTSIFVMESLYISLDNTRSLKAN